MGIVAGLVIGKPLGIFIFSFAAIRADVCKLPDNITWRFIIGMGALGGIGFSMSIFIRNLTFVDPGVIQNSQIAILWGIPFKAPTTTTKKSPSISYGCIQRIPQFFKKT